MVSNSIPKIPQIKTLKLPSLPLLLLLILCHPPEDEPFDCDSFNFEYLLLATVGLTQ